MVCYFKEIDYLKHATRGKTCKQQQTEKWLWKEITARKYKVNSMALNLNHNIEKIIDGNPYFLCFCTALWFPKILSWFSKIFHSTLLSIAHRNVLFHVILVHHHHLDQVPLAKKPTQIILICIFYCSPHSMRILLMCPSQVLIEVTKEIKIKLFEFFLLRLKLLYHFFENFVWFIPIWQLTRMLQIRSVRKPTQRQ